MYITKEEYQEYKSLLKNKDKKAQEVREYYQNEVYSLRNEISKVRQSLTLTRKRALTLVKMVKDLKKVGVTVREYWDTSIYGRTDIRAVQVYSSDLSKGIRHKLNKLLPRCYANRVEEANRKCKQYDVALQQMRDISDGPNICKMSKIRKVLKTVKF